MCLYIFWKFSVIYFVLFILFERINCLKLNSLFSTIAIRFRKCLLYCIWILWSILWFFHSKLGLKTFSLKKTNALHFMILGPYERHCLKIFFVIFNQKCFSCFSIKRSITNFGIKKNWKVIRNFFLIFHFKLNNLFILTSGFLFIQKFLGQNKTYIIKTSNYAKIQN